MVLPLDVLHARALDPEDRHPLSVHASDLDVAEFAAAHEPQRSQEKVLGLKHRRLLLPSHACGLVEESRLRWDRSEVSPSLLWISGRRR